MSDLTDLMRHVFGRFAHPETDPLPHANDENMDAIDHRLIDVEKKLLEMKAQLRVMKKAANPRGIGRD